MELAKVGSVVWARYSTYPEWPSVVVHERERAFISDALPKTPEGSVLVRFLNDGQYAMVPITRLRKFEEHIQETEEKSNSKEFRTKLKGAVEAAIAYLNNKTQAI